jgi:hypothetical protein
MSLSDVADIAKATLVAFIKAQISGLTVLDEFPYSNQTLAMPSLTISTNKPKRTPQANAIQTAVTSPNDAGQVTANLYVADWDDTFQLDLWTRNKSERQNYTTLILNLFNSQQDAAGNNQPDGLSLQMAAHFNEWCRYEIDSVQCVDDSAAAERQERREKITVLMNCREITQRTYYAITQLQVFNQATAQAAALSDDTQETDDFTYFQP